jgi:hypothetical protein
MVSSHLEKSNVNDTTGRAFNKVGFANEARKILGQFVKESENHYKCHDQIPIPQPVISEHLLAQKIPPEVFHEKTKDENAMLKWDSHHSGANICLTELDTLCFLHEGGYCFRTILADIGYTTGVRYWEIHADSRTENELKIGIVGQRDFNYNTVSKIYQSKNRHFAITNTAGATMDLLNSDTATIQPDRNLGRPLKIRENWEFALT